MAKVVLRGKYPTSSVGSKNLSSSSILLLFNFFLALLLPILQKQSPVQKCFRKLHINAIFEFGKGLGPTSDKEHSPLNTSLVGSKKGLQQECSFYALLKLRKMVTRTRKNFERIAKLSILVGKL